MIARVLHLPLLLAILPLAVLAGEDKAPVAPYVLKNRSTFSAVSDEQRAPFWPIGWLKRKPMSVTSAEPLRTMEQPKAQFDASNIKLTSILLGTPSLAIINGRSYSEGDFLRQPKAAVVAGTAPRVRVYRINDGSVVLQNQTELITVAIQRPELVQRGPEQELLTEDRP
jgi:hypothetical protein